MFAGDFGGYIKFPTSQTVNIREITPKLSSCVTERLLHFVLEEGIVKEEESIKF